MRNFVSWWVFFLSWVSNIFLVAIGWVFCNVFAKWAEVEKSGDFFMADIFFSPKATKKITQPRKKTPLFFHLRSLRKNVAKYSTKRGHKKYYSPKIKKIIQLSQKNIYSGNSDKPQGGAFFGLSHWNLIK